MTVRTVIFDVYKTLLRISPPPADADNRWELLWEDYFADPARLTLTEFEATCKKIIAREHATARSRGVQFPEVNWKEIAREVLPELARIADAKVDDFLFAHAQLQRTVQMSPVAAATLRALQNAALPMGIASNSQHYTWRELDTALAVHGLNRALFDNELCFWSFERGFSKPDPEVFRWLAARLQPRGVPPANALMVGDRQDNDIEPARQVGWQTWKLTSAGETDNPQAGDWESLQHYLRLHCGLE